MNFCFSWVGCRVKSYRLVLEKRTLIAKYWFFIISEFLSRCCTDCNVCSLVSPGLLCTSLDMNASCCPEKYFSPGCFRTNDIRCRACCKRFGRYSPRSTVCIFKQNLYHLSCEVMLLVTVFWNQAVCWWIVSIESKICWQRSRVLL